MEYTVTAIGEYQEAINAISVLSKKGEKEVKLSLYDNTLTITSMGGGAIMHHTVDVVGGKDGEAWVDGAQLSKVSSLLPVGRELKVTLGQALTYRIQGYAAQDIALAASHPVIPDLGVKEQLFEGVDLSPLTVRDSKSLPSLTLRDYVVILSTNLLGALVRITIPTAYKCTTPVSTEVSPLCLGIMKRMREASLSHYSKGYLGATSDKVTLIIPISTFPGGGKVWDTLGDLPTEYTIKVLQQDMLSALNWSALSAPTVVTLSYTDPMPFIEMKAGDNATPTKIAFTQHETEEGVEETTLTMGVVKYAPSSLLSALESLPKGDITITGKVSPATSKGGAIPFLLLTSQSGDSTIGVLVNALA